MSAVLAVKLVAIFAVLAVGWAAGRARLLGPEAADVLNRAAFTLFVPALLFRTAAGISVAELPWVTIAAYYVPTLGVLFTAYAWCRITVPGGARPTIRALSVSFSNTVQIGIPLVAALFGEAGLAVLIAIISLHALLLLTTGTVLAEADLARAGQGEGRRSAGLVVRRSLFHPVVAPILMGLAYNATGWSIPALVDDVLATLGAAVIPVSLVTIGLTMYTYGKVRAVPRALARAAVKLVLHPAVVLAVAYFAFGLRGLPLTVTVLCAALPTGTNVLLFAGRYQTLHGETAAVTVAATAGFIATGTLWLLLLA